MSDAEADAKVKLFSQCADALAGLGSVPPADAFFTPGRIEFLGKHTDYAGGRSLVCTVERGICLLVSPRSDNTIRIVDTADGSTAEFPLSPDLQPTPGHWSNYPMTVARRVAQNFPGALRGGDIAIASDLPRAAGMSSSSAVVVATFLALATLNRLAERPEYQSNIKTLEDLAGYLGTTENGQNFGTLAGDKGVGTFGGSQDHTAILCCRPRQLEQYAFCPVRHERTVPLPHDHVFAIGVSGVVAEKTGNALERYNRASQLVSAILRLWRSTTGRNDATLAAATVSSADAPDRIRGILRSQPDAADLLDRFDQFCEEAFSIIPAAGDALIAHDLPKLGQLVDRSQYLTEHKLKNQVPQTAFLARSARDLGAVAASGFGAGFGGSVWALVPERTAAEFLDRWRARYVQQFPNSALRPAFLTTRAGPAAMHLPFAPSPLAAER
jgi:galactokinase